MTRAAERNSWNGLRGTTGCGGTTNVCSISVTKRNIYLFQSLSTIPPAVQRIKKMKGGEMTSEETEDCGERGKREKEEGRKKQGKVVSRSET